MSEDATNMSNVDDILVGIQGAHTHNDTDDVYDESEDVPMDTEEKTEPEPDKPNSVTEYEVKTAEVKTANEYGIEESEPTEEAPPPPPKERYYTQDEVQQMMRDRLERQARNLQPKDEEQSESDDWREDLRKYISTTLREEQEQINNARAREQAEREFNEMAYKFQTGATRFPDFANVVSKAGFTNEMTKAGLHFDDSAAFFYAAAKLMPAEVKRIAKLPSAERQIIELGRLDEKLRASTANNSKKQAASRPISKVRGDGVTKKEKSEPVGDILAAEDARRSKSLRDRAPVYPSRRRR